MEMVRTLGWRWLGHWDGDDQDTGMEMVRTLGWR